MSLNPTASPANAPEANATTQRDSKRAKDEERGGVVSHRVSKLGQEIRAEATRKGEQDGNTIRVVRFQVRERGATDRDQEDECQAVEEAHRESHGRPGQVCRRDEVRDIEQRIEIALEAARREIDADLSIEEGERVVKMVVV